MIIKEDLYKYISEMRQLELDMSEYYGALSNRLTDERLKKIFYNLSAVEARHAEEDRSLLLNLF